MKSSNLENAKDFFPTLKKALNRVPPYSFGYEPTVAAREKAFAEITALIESKGGTITKRFDGTRVRLFGISASSTSSLSSALENWIRQLTVKAMAAQNGGAE